MEYQVEKQKGGVKFEFTVPVEDWEKEMDAAYQKNKGKYSIPGFRKGHAPRKVIEKMYGAGIFFDDAFNACASKAYSQALSEHEDVYPVDDPKVDISDYGDKSLKFIMEVTTRPEVTLGAYKGLTLEKSDYAVTDKDVDDELERARQAKSRIVDVTDRAVKDGDTVKLDYAGSIDGVPFNGGTAKDQELVIGSNTFIPGFEPQLVGMQIGETKDISVKFPDDYHAEELKGKDSVFNVTVHAIKEKQLPELNDEFAKDTTKFESLKEYREDTEKRLKDTAEHRADTENKNRMIDAIVENATAEIPDCMVQSELDYMLKDFEQRLAYAYGGMKLDDYFKYTGSSREDFKKERAEDAKKQVKTRLVIEDIIKAEKIEATDADVDKRLKEIAENAGKTFEEYKKQFSPYQLSHLKNDIVIEKTLNMLADANTFEKKAKSAPKKKAESDKAGDSAEKGDKESAPKAKSTAKAKKSTTDQE